MIAINHDPKYLVALFQFMYSERSTKDNRKASSEIYYDYLGCKLEQRLVVAKKEVVERYHGRGG